ncbi:amylo-alpha-1,6-glucosidase [Acuticoccus sp. M5D2P5]|uniref:amylo-alpha-1,6-glucosidase n=1 Tax=Acuticoccus kalidii TaxID=2910977 RepID=UPI001F36388B|nr:glycogen debranching N-terminal domain-containing protein [Acuticoccus kalidii]MCF3934887.1 amylo-alpha-1,6-glucosidase [Acuticoccus kalidii]
MATGSADSGAWATPADGGGLQAPFVIPATALLQERRPRTLKQGDTFAVFDHNGDAIAGPGSPEGLYHRDTRYLSGFALTIEGACPILLSSTVRDDNAVLSCDLTNPDLYGDDGHCWLDHDLLHIGRSRLLWQAGCFERLIVRNYDMIRRRVRIGIAFGADFADIFEVRGARRARRGTMHPAELERAGVVLSYTGLDDRRRTTRIMFDPPPDRLAGDRVEFTLDLAPRERRSLFVAILCDREAEREPCLGFFRAMRNARRALRRSASRAAAVSTSHESFNETVRRSVSDIYMLLTDEPEGPYPYAGIPWYSTVFGRDALITAWEVLWLDPMIARGVISYLAANQAVDIEPESDAEPGKILHEVRHGEMAELGEVPFRRYYGSVDATPLFVMLCGAYFGQTGDLATIRTLWKPIEAALRWIETFGDRDGDGFVEYERQAANGLANQGWKDSYDAVFHADGTLAEGPIALAEVQAYVYAAYVAAATMARALGDAVRGGAFEAKADALRTKFDAAFFDAALGTYAIALDGRKRPCRVRSSNAGHALFTGIAFEDRAAVVASTLMAPASFSGWGVRTIASGEARYNPMSYHNGSVWPHDNALVAAGLARYGYRRDAARILEGIFDASLYLDLSRLPELICGFGRQRSRGPTFYPVACIPQAWAAAAPLSALRPCLGFDFDPATNIVSFDHPVLPRFLQEVRLSRIAVVGGTIDIALYGTGSQVVVDVLRRDTAVKVVTTT